MMEIDVAVLDVETTGFSRFDRIVEIAILRIDRQCRITREYQTLINPLQDVGPTHVHNVTATMVKDAPAFKNVARDILAFLPEKTLVVGHNVSFDLKFIERELSAELGRPVRYNSFCTLKQSRKYLTSPSYKLGEICRCYGISNDEAHAAMGDTKATLKLFEILLGEIEKKSRVNLLSNYREYPVPPREPCFVKTRSACSERSPRSFSLNDQIAFVSPLAGKSICFTGSSRALDREGKSLSRGAQEALVRRTGLSVQSHVSRSLDILVAADKNSLSGKARRARQYGILIMEEVCFWQEAGFLSE